jgi:two-component system, NarL family, nitrate/nitrite response regulator NarL
MMSEGVLPRTILAMSAPVAPVGPRKVKTPPQIRLLTTATLPKQQEKIAELIVQGMSNKEIARKLNITESTVKVHLHAIYTRYDVSRTQLALWASWRVGLYDHDRYDQ